MLPIVFFPRPRDPNVQVSEAMQAMFLCLNAYLLAFYYLNTEILIPKLLVKKRWFWYFLVIIVCLIAYVLLPRLFEDWVRSELPPKSKFRFPFRRRFYPFTGATAVFFLVFTVSTSIKLIQQWLRLEQNKKEIETEKLNTELSFLKSQINPHFLHNTLNFLYAKSLPYSAELSEGILTLSDIMRYALSEGNARDGKAPLKDEIEHVRNVIKINQLRFSNNLKVDFKVEGVVNGATIIPFVLITIVENAFKHGDLKSSTHPIDVLLRIDGKQLCFYCRNKKKTGPKEISTGIGLDNIRKRLDLAYGANYSFGVSDEAEFYTTELTISQL